MYILTLPPVIKYLYPGGICKTEDLQEREKNREEFVRTRPYIVLRANGDRS